MKTCLQFLSFYKCFFILPDPSPKEQSGEGETKTHRAVFTFVCQPSDGRTDAQLEGNWGVIPGNVAKREREGRGRRMVYFMRILAGNYIFKISCEPGTSLCINVPIITLGLTV